MRAPLPVVVDINVLVDAVVAEPDPSGWNTPSPVRGDPAAMALAAINQGMEFGLWLSPHILAGTKRVLTGAYGFEQTEADRHEPVLSDAALAACRASRRNAKKTQAFDSRAVEPANVGRMCDFCGRKSAQTPELETRAGQSPGICASPDRRRHPLLDCLDQRLQVLQRRVWQHAVAQVEDVAGAACSPAQHVPSPPPHEL